LKFDSFRRTGTDGGTGIAGFMR